jgi:outer membrane receptor for ferrienterochelin and colicin
MKIGAWCAFVVLLTSGAAYVMPLLPSGVYTVVFELAGFGVQTRTVSIAPTQMAQIDVELGPAAVSETVQVARRAKNALMDTSQVATSFSQELIANLPTARDIHAALMLSPSVHATGPSGAYTIAGSMSFENLFLVNGVTVNENLRGQAIDLYIEDAIQETTVATAGISAEYGRFGGGVVHLVTKSGGNRFSGSFRDTLTTTPVQGVNWDYGPNFGRATSRFAHTTPQSLRLSFGVRF